MVGVGVGAGARARAMVTARQHGVEEQPAAREAEQAACDGEDALVGVRARVRVRVSLTLTLTPNLAGGLGRVAVAEVVGADE